MNQNKPICQIYAQLDQVGDQISAELERIHALGLVCDLSVSLERVAAHRTAIVRNRERGGLVAPNLYPAMLDPACADPNWWTYDEAACRRLLGRAQERFATLGVGPLEAVNTYTPGNAFVRACRALGIRHVLGFCAPTHIEDGAWRITHLGAPMSPFFAGDEDFRKPEDPAGRPDPVLIASMELRNPLVCRQHWSEGPFCPLNAQAADRWLEPGPEPLPAMAMAEDWLRLAELGGGAPFFAINLQYFFAGRCRDHNLAMLRWLARQRDMGRVQVAGLKAYGAALAARRGDPAQRTYWRGEMMGFHVGARPGGIADVVVEETATGQLVWERPAALPRLHYDYRPAWDYPAFDREAQLPPSAPWQDLPVDCAWTEGPGSRRCTLTLRNPGPARPVDLALWQPLDGLAGPFALHIDGPWRAEALPHPGGSGGVVLLRGMLPAGATTLALAVAHAGAARPCQRAWGGLVQAQTVRIDGRWLTTLAAQTPERFSLRLRPRPGAARPDAVVESLCGIEHTVRPLTDAGLDLVFDATRLACWHRLWDLTVDDLDLDGVAEVETALRARTAALLADHPDLHADGHGYQPFAYLRGAGRWEAALGRRRGEAELARMQAWFRAQRPQAGPVLIEAHPGIYLPRGGSITKVLGHPFNHIACAPGHGFQELCADYPQAWDWGVGAYVQWSHLSVALDGLDPQGGPYLLHLHAADYEARGLVQRLAFADADAHDGLLLGRDQDWVLPAGLDGRWRSEALLTVAIPAACLAWRRIAVHLRPAHPLKLHDWVRERGAAPLFSHLWVTAPGSDA